MLSVDVAGTCVQDEIVSGEVPLFVTEWAPVAVNLQPNALVTASEIPENVVTTSDPEAVKAIPHGEVGVNVNVPRDGCLHAVYVPLPVPVPVLDTVAAMELVAQVSVIPFMFHCTVTEVAVNEPAGEIETAAAVAGTARHPTAAKAPIRSRATCFAKDLRAFMGRWPSEAWTAGNSS